MAKGKMIGRISADKVLEIYADNVLELANLVAKINEIRTSFEYVMDATGDEGDPKFYLDEAMINLANALSAAVTYSKEYKDEAEGKSQREDQGDSE